MLYTACEILLCMFAAVGILHTVKSFFDAAVARRLHVSCRLLIENVRENDDNDDMEYTLRVLEGILSRHGLGDIVNGITVGHDVPLDDNLRQKLEKEFGNLSSSEE